MPTLLLPPLFQIRGAMQSSTKKPSNVYMQLCMCMCLYEYVNEYEYVYVYVHLYVYVHVCVCVCACVCERALLSLCGRMPSP